MTGGPTRRIYAMANNCRLHLLAGTFVCSNDRVAPIGSCAKLPSVGANSSTRISGQSAAARVVYTRDKVNHILPDTFTNR